jgi:glycogen debranching enzyme
MTVAPELFADKGRARDALQFGWNILAGELGAKTLDPKDSQYRGAYVNHLETTDYFSSRGFNYHQVNISTLSL